MVTQLRINGVAENDERLPPYNSEAEQYVLGAILNDNKAYHRVAQLVRCEDFGNALHSQIFAEVGKRIAEGRSADPVLLKGIFDQDKEGTYLATLAGAAVLITNPEDYARLVHDIGTRRQIIAICEDTITNAASLADLARPAELLIEEHTAQLGKANGLTSWELPQFTSLGDWLQRDLPAPDFLLGDVLSTTSRMELIGRTGLGKTNFAMAMGMAIAKGDPFLHWKASKRPRRVLFIDGEMSNRQFKRRLQDAVQRAGGSPATFRALCRDDCPKMDPLDSEVGQRFVDRLVESIGGVDLIIFDNIDALTTDDEDFGAQSWQRTLPWIRHLTRRVIGQLWLHHTGQDESRGYGSKKREWPLDVVAVMEEVERPDSDMAFALRFTKARERTPDNRSDFEPVVIRLAGDKWFSEKGNVSDSGKNKKRDRRDLALDILNDEIGRGNGTVPPPDSRIPPYVPCLTMGEWRKAYELRSPAETPEAAKRAFYRAAEKLIKELKLVGKFELWVWPVST